MNNDQPKEKAVENGKYKLIEFEVTNYGRFFIYFPGQPVYIRYSLKDTHTEIENYWALKLNINVKSEVL